MASAAKPGKSQKSKGAKSTARAPSRARGGQAKGKTAAKTSKGAADRRSPESPGHKRGRLTLMDRVHRSRTIASERAKKRPTAWKTISEKVGLSQSQCREAYADFLRWADPEKDPMAVVDETIEALKASMVEASDTAACAEPGSQARTGAIRTFMEAATTRLALMQAAGKVPRYLGHFQMEQELRTVLKDLADLLKTHRHRIEGEALRDFLELAERVGRRGQIEGGKPVLEGSAQERAA